MDGLPRSLLSIALAATLVLGACAGDADDDATPEGTATTTTTVAAEKDATVASFEVPAGSHPHDVWARADGTVWYTAQGSGELGLLDPETGKVKEIALGAGSRPHGVIEGPDGAAWITDSGLNAMVRVDPKDEAVTRYPLPAGRPGVNLNTAAFAPDGTLWTSQSTSQEGWLQKVDADTGAVLAKYMVAAGIEDLAFDAAGFLWSVSEAGSQRWSNWPTYFPVIFRIDPTKLR